MPREVWQSALTDAADHLAGTTGGIPGAPIVGDTVVDDMLRSRGDQWVSGRRLALWSHATEPLLLNFNNIHSDDRKFHRGRGTFPVIARRSLWHHPVFSRTCADKDFDKLAAARARVAVLVASSLNGLVTAQQVAMLKGISDSAIGNHVLQLGLARAIRLRAGAAASVLHDHIGHKLTGVGIEAVKCVADLVTLGVRRVQTERATVARLCFRDWLSNALLRGAKAAHALVKRRTGEVGQANPLVVDGLTFPSVSVAVNARTTNWEKKCTRDALAASAGRASILYLIVVVRRSERDPIPFDVFEAAIPGLDGNRGLGSDATEIKILKGAPREASMDYDDILVHSQMTTSWPVLYPQTGYKGLTCPQTGCKGFLRRER